MKHTCSFLHGLFSCRDIDVWTPPQPLCVFAGRSNVGKSSLMNRILGSRSSRVSRSPGRTQGILVFQKGAVGLADLPGYGFSQTPAPERAQLMERFFRHSAPQISRVFLLVDSRHGLKPFDRIFLTFMQELSVPTEGVLTKIDKVLRRNTSEQQAKAKNRVLTVEDQQLFAHIWMVSDFMPATWEALTRYVQAVTAPPRLSEERGTDHADRHHRRECVSSFSSTITEHLSPWG